MAAKEQKVKLLRYFKTSSVPDVISVLFILAGAFIYYYAWQIWVLATPLLLIGIAGLIISYSFKISDQTYTDYFTKQFEAMPKERGVEPEAIFTEYSFEGTVYARVDKTNAPRSEVCVRTAIYFGKQLKLVNAVCNVAEGTCDFRTLELAHASAEVNNAEIKIGGATKKIAYMTITDGEQSCTFPVKYNDIEIDQFMERLNKRYQKSE